MGGYHMGTLVVCLPTHFSGGQCVMKYEEEEETLDWAAQSPTAGVQWVFLFGPVDHHIEPVTSGVRLTIAYDIFATDLESTLMASSLDPKSFLFGQHLSKALGQSDFLPAGGTVGFALTYPYPVISEAFDFGREYPKLLKGADALLYNVALSLGLDVQLRGVYEEVSDCVHEGHLDTETVTFVDNFGPYALDFETGKNRPNFEAYDDSDSGSFENVPVRDDRDQETVVCVRDTAVDHLVEQIEDIGDEDYYLRHRGTSESVLLTSTEANGEAFCEGACDGRPDGYDEFGEISEMLDHARAKVEQSVVWARRPKSHTFTQSANLVGYEEVRNNDAPGNLWCRCYWMTHCLFFHFCPQKEDVSAALFLDISAFGEGVRRV
jgi:hypothetical protein